MNSIFAYIYETFKIKKPLRLIELFAGYGSQALALKYLNIPFEHHAICEFNRYAVQAYNEIHGTNFKTLDIKNITANDLNIIDPGAFTYLLTYSFPCQDLSLAGKGRGMSKGNNTRSGLLWELERLLKDCENLPQILLMENVPEVIGQKNIADFNLWQLFLESLGYKNYFKLLNAKDFTIPQNRNRCFMISLLGDYNYNFPKTYKLYKRLKDLLEHDVEEKYFLNDRAIRGIFNSNFTQKQKQIQNKDNICDSILSRDYKDSKCIVVGNVKLSSYESCNRVYDPDGIAPTNMTKMEPRSDGLSNTITTVQKDNYILVPEATKKGYSKAYDGDGIYINRPHQKRGTVQNGMTPTIKCCSNDIAVVLKEDLVLINGEPTTDYEVVVIDDKAYIFSNCVYYRIRKLTPKECFRLMGVKDEDYNKLTLSNSQKYKLAGNSIVTTVLMAIIKELT